MTRSNSWQLLAIFREATAARPWLAAALIYFAAMCHLEVVNPAKPLRMSIALHGLVAGASAFALIGLGLARRRELTERSLLSVLWLLSCAFLGFSVLRFVISHVDHHDVVVGLRNLLRLTCLIAFAALPAWVAGFRRAGLGLQVLVVLLLLAARCLVLAASSDPRIDVFTLATEAAQALWRGENPYAVETSNLYEGTKLDLGYSPGYNYFPALLLANALSYELFGDVRALYLAAEALTVLCLLRFTRALGWSTFAAWTFAVFWCSNTLSFQVIEKWNDSLVLMLVVGMLLLLAERRFWIAGAAFGLAAASKQYVPLCALPIGLWLLRESERRDQRRFVAGAGLAAGLVCLPFLIDRPDALFARTLFHFAGTPFREESLSLLNWARLTFGFGTDSVWVRVSPYVGLALGLGASAAIAVRKPAEADYAASLQRLIVSLLCLSAGTFQFIKQSFLNYHYFFLGISVLLLAAMVPDRAGREHSPAATEPLAH